MINASFYGHSDPTAMAAIGAASKKLKNMEPLSRTQISENYIDFSVNSVLNASGEEQIDVLMKRLGTIALSSEMDDTDASVFCHKLENKTHGKYSYNVLIGWYHKYKAYIRHGGPNGANNFSPPMIAKVTPKTGEATITSSAT